jgi:cell surface protein SprA
LPSDSLQKIDSVKVFDVSKIKTLQKKQESYASLLNTQREIFSAATGFFPPDSTENSDSTGIIDSLGIDTSKVDTSGIAADTVKVDSMALDSTARLKYFHYERRDLPYITLERHRHSAFFAQPTARKRTVRIDSTGKFVVIEEKVAGQETKILLRVPIEDYIEAELDLHRRKLWEDVGYKYELKSSKRELGELIKDITQLEIPLPKVGLLSIFGEPKISLKIGGAVDIHGAWRNENTQGVTASRYGNTRNEPDFKQQVQITVNGTIGDKLHIDADWNTERTFQYENQLKIKYEGYEDEIIQSIEAGNVSLQTSPLVGGSEALFGLKAKFKLGPLSLTTLASQKKGETEEVSVNSGTTSQEFNLRAYDYSTNHYFIDTVYASQTPALNVFEKYYSKAVPEVIQALRVVNIEVWKSVIVYTVDRTKYRQANAFMDLPAISEGGTYTEAYKEDTTRVPGKVETGWFELLQEGVDYVLHPETGYITFKTSLQNDDVIAVAYQQQTGLNPPNNIYGEFLKNAADTSKNMVLKLVKPSGLQPTYKEAWMLQLKNIYPLGGRNIKEDGFEFNIKYEQEGQEPVTDLSTPNGPVRLLTAFGLDLLDASKNANPDNKFDWRPNLTIFPETGEVIFPTLQPFGDNLPDKIPDSLRFQDIYDTTKTFAQQKKVKDKWLITGKYSGEATSVYQLGFNIVENSVRVLLNGRELTPGTDYTVDYNIGQLTIRNEAALVPGANLKITYEKNDLFQLASKTLLGARGVFEFSDRTQLGFSLLNLNQQTLSDKVRIGEEPLSNTIYGVDFKTGVDLPIVTKALDNIISTREMSSVNVNGEYAYMSPDPNTKKSTISSDQGKSIAYIDDFEGAKKVIPIGISYTGWRDLSPPDSLPGLSGLGYRQLMDYKGKSIWYSVTPSDVNVKQIWPLKTVAQEDQQAAVMDYVFVPDTPGTYNYNPQLGDHQKDWGGIMKLLSSTASNLVDQNMEFIEFWAKVDEAPQGAVLYLDLGRVSEDVIPNDTLNTEDRPPQNDLIDQGEDVGLDGLTDAQERARYGSSKSDPSGDNFSFTKTGSTDWRDYFHINGTEGNAVLTDIGRFPDTEDLNKNGNLDRANSYFRYEIPIDTNKATNPYIAGGGNTEAHWHLFRIPLKDYKREIGNPSLTDIEFIRFVISGASSTVHLRLTEFNLTGSQWQKVIPPDDSVLSVSVVNLEDNPEYTLPPGVFQERDRTRPDQQIYRNEQSLNLIIKDLPEGQSREAVKYLYKPLDVFNYKQMKLFVHGDTHVGPGSVTDTTGGTYAAYVYFRFGGDTTNFYEYRQPVTAGWNEISINFSELTAIKQARNDSDITRLIEKPVPGKEGHLYGVRGNPTLTSIKFLLIGIHNVLPPSHNIEPGITHPAVFGTPISGEVWINELRVVGADDSPGWAYNLSSQIKLADLMTVNLTLSQTNPYFHRLSDRFGTRIESKNWGISTDVNILKLLPISLPESNLRLNYSHNESIGKPLYLPGTDIKVDQAAKQIESLRSDTSVITTKTPEQIISESQTINTSDSWSSSGIKITIPTSAWYIRDTFNNLIFGFNYNKTYSRSPTVLSNKGWIWNATMNYALSLSPTYYFQPVDIPVLGTIVALFSDYRNLKIYYTPQNFSFNATAKRQRNTSITRSQTGSASNEIVSRDFGTTRGFNFNWKLTEGGLLNLSTSYNVNITSSLAYLETTANDQQRPENEIWHDIFSGAFFGKDYRYTQTFDLKTGPRLPALWNINRYFQLNAGYNVNYNWNFDFRQDTVGRSGGFASRLSTGLTLRLKALTDPLFEEKSETSVNESQNRRGINRGRDLENRRRQLEGGNEVPDTTKPEVNNETQPSDTLQQKPKKPALARAIGFLKSIVHSVFFDYETISINFTNDNSVSKSGILGEGTGFNNFWGIKYNYNKGPSRAFMLGLSSDVGRRAPNGNLQDVFSQKNGLDFRTSRPLWTGAKLDINWKVDWSVNKNTTISTDQFGNPTIQNVTETSSISRSFLSFPPSLFLSIFGNGIKKVNELFNPNSPNPQQNLSDAFVEGFETFPWLSKLSFLKDYAKYIPRPNWHITWDGLENFLFFKSFAKKVSLDHSYSSTYTEGTKLNPDGVKEIINQRIDYGFSPLAGINITFNDMWGGNLIGSIKYGTKTIYDLGLTTKNISETFSKDIGITAGFSKSGFELPLFGISLKNDIEFSFSYTSSKNSVVRYDMLNFTEEGTPQDGTLRTTLEPRIKYTISSKVTLSIFYTRTTVEPEGASRIPPTTTNEAGLDVHISIQ